MPHYELKAEYGTPMWRVWIDGKPDQLFTSLTAAKAWVAHRQSHNEKVLAKIHRLQGERR